MRRKPGGCWDKLAKERVRYRESYKTTEYRTEEGGKRRTEALKLKLQRRTAIGSKKDAVWCCEGGMSLLCPELFVRNKTNKTGGGLMHFPTST